jgi:hypothetical protein
MKKVLVGGFVCGALAVLVFHQGTNFLLFHNFAFLKGLGLPDGFRPMGPGFSMRPVPPFNVPQVASIAFWGGLWGIVLAALTRYGRLPDLLTGLIFGAVVCTVVGFSVFASLRGQPMWAGGNTLTWARVMLVNGAWGWGAAFLMRPLSVAR